MKKRRVWSILLAICMVLAWMPTAAFAVENAQPTGQSAEDPIFVPAEQFTVSNGEITEIKKEWREANAGKFVAVKIPAEIDGVKITAIGANLFNPSYSSKNGGVKIVSLDLSEAANLTAIRSQAFANCSYLSGVLDLSKTKITTLEKMAFLSCKALTGAILPEALQELGNSQTGGSVFKDCSGLQFVRTANGNPSAVFELPHGLTTIWTDCFRGAFASGVEAAAVVPESVVATGSGAFNTAHISQVIVEGADTSGYHASSFASSGQLVVFNDASGYLNFAGRGKSYITTPIQITFEGTGIVQTKLRGQTLQYTLKEDGTWEKDPAYRLPGLEALQTPAPGYELSWSLNGAKVTDSESYKLNASNTETTITAELILMNPTIAPEVNGVKQDSYHMTVAQKDDQVSYVGVRVSHPLLMEEQGTEREYVYFTYRWWDEQSAAEYPVSGARSKSEPELFSAQLPPVGAEASNFRLVETGNAVIPIRGQEDARTNTDQYMVEILGYHVVDGKTELFYKSHRNFIDFIVDQDTQATVAASYVFQVAVEQSYTVAFDADGGTAVEPVVVEAGEAVKEPAPAPEKEGYRFLGWYLGEEKFDFSTPVTAPLCLKAKWEKLYTVIYTDGVEGEEIFPDQATTGLRLGADTPAFQGTPQRAGYLFQGWNPAVSGKVEQDAVYVAQWKKAEDAARSTNPEDAASPQTGDSRNIGLWVALLVLAVAGMAGALVCKYRRKKAAR